MRAPLAVSALALAALASPALAARWQIVPAQSSVGFTADWNGQKIAGRFARFTAAIDFDPAKPEAAKVSALIDLASVSTADRTVNGSLPGDDWFGFAKGASVARFTATRITRGRAPNSYVAAGTLAMRGRSVPVTLPFTLAVAGATATMTGATTLDRRAFAIGAQSDAAGTWVSFAVPVTIRIVARR